MLLLLLFICICIVLLVNIHSSTCEKKYQIATNGLISAFAFIDKVEEVPHMVLPLITSQITPPLGIQSTPKVITTNNPAADAAVVEINKFRATFGLPPMIYDVSKNPDADACAAYDAKNGYHSSMKAGLTKGASGQCECSGATGQRCVQLYEREESFVQNPKSTNPTCGSTSCGHWCLILGSFTHISSGTSGNFSTQNFYNGRPRCSF